MTTNMMQGFAGMNTNFETMMQNMMQSMTQMLTAGEGGASTISAIMPTPAAPTIPAAPTTPVAPPTNEAQQEPPSHPLANQSIWYRNSNAPPNPPITTTAMLPKQPAQNPHPATTIVSAPTLPEAPGTSEKVGKIKLIERKEGQNALQYLTDLHNNCK